MLRLSRILRRRRSPAQRDAGYSTETVLVIALLSVLAIGAVAVISQAVLAKAESITLD